MYVRRGARIHRLLWAQRWALLVLIVLAVGTELLEPYVSSLALFSMVYVGVFSTALSIFLVFRFNEAYERWWEARKLWGSLVNLSRDVARQSLTLLPGAQRTESGARLVRRQIAFAHALRIHLRTGGTPAGQAEVRSLLTRLVPEEAATLGESGNVPSALLVRQSDELATLLGDGVESRLLLMRFDENLGRLYDVQGGCERIKNTAFPDNVALITRCLVWALVLLLMFATIGPEGRDGPVDVLIVCLMAMGYLWIESLGNDLKNPFENGPNDTPMTSICVTIERDLLEMLGETELPDPVAPRDGVLM